MDLEQVARVRLMVRARMEAMKNMTPQESEQLMDRLSKANPILEMLRQESKRRASLTKPSEGRE